MTDCQRKYSSEFPFLYMFHQNKQKIAKASELCEARQELISRHVRAVLPNAQSVKVIE
jgi:hypothetical protein